MKTTHLITAMLFFVFHAAASTDSVRNLRWSAGAEMGRSPMDMPGLFYNRNQWQVGGPADPGTKRLVLLPGVFGEMKLRNFSLQGGLAFGPMNFTETSSFQSVLQGELSTNVNSMELKQQQWSGYLTLKRYMSAGRFSFSAGLRLQFYRWSEGVLTESMENTRYYPGSSQLHYHITNRNQYTLPAGWTAGAGPTAELTYALQPRFRIAMACDILYLMSSGERGMDLDYYFSTLTYNSNGSIYYTATETRRYDLNTDLPRMTLSGLLPTLRVYFLLYDPGWSFCKAKKK